MLAGLRLIPLSSLKGSNAVMQPVFCATGRSTVCQLAVSYRHNALLMCVFGLKELFLFLHFCVPWLFLKSHLDI